MNTQQDHDEKIKSEFKATRKKQLIWTLPVLPLMLVMLFWGDKKPGINILGIPLIAITLVVVVMSLIFSLLNWRSPACKRYLGKQINPKYCSKCGVELR
jgi:hypothetical protein